MKKTVILLSLLFTLIMGCNKETPTTSYMSQGTITGVDSRFCACCGGWFIDIENETYRFYNVPADSDLDMGNETLPLQVELDWEKDENGCLGDEILVSAIKVIR